MDRFVRRFMREHVSRGLGPHAFCSAAGTWYERSRARSGDRRDWCNRPLVIGRRSVLLGLDAGLVQRCCVEVLRFCCADSCQAFMGERLLTNRYACYLAYKLSTAQA